MRGRDRTFFLCLTGLGWSGRAQPCRCTNGLPALLPLLRWGCAGHARARHDASKIRDETKAGRFVSILARSPVRGRAGSCKRPNPRDSAGAVAPGRLILRENRHAGGAVPQKCVMRRAYRQVGRRRRINALSVDGICLTPHAERQLLFWICQIDWGKWGPNRGVFRKVHPSGAGYRGPAGMTRYRFRRTATVSATCYDVPCDTWKFRARVKQ